MKASVVEVQCERNVYVYTNAVYTHAHAQVDYVRGEWHSGKFNTSLSTLGGKERKRGRKLQQPDKEKRPRKESKAQRLHAIAADVARGSSASKRMLEMTDCAPSCLALCGLSQLWVGLYKMKSNQSNLAQVGSNQHLKTPASRVQESKGSVEQTAR